jgi:hypothetical protein
LPSGLGCRQRASRQPIPSHRPADRSHPFSGLTSPLPGDDGDSFVRGLRGEGQFSVVVGFFVFIGLMRGPADKPPPASHTPTATCRNQSPPGGAPRTASSLGTRTGLGNLSMAPPPHPFKRLR